MGEQWEPGAKFSAALGFAVETHATQRRKGSETPYVAHLLAVASLVIEDGGSEDEAIAALLHDAAEDQGGEEMLATIGERFGPDVERIVAACSDTFETPKPPWPQRKESYIAAIPGKAADEQRVSLADKVANSRAILFDLRTVGDELWARFNVGRDGQLWYYRALADAFQVNRPGSLANELDRTVASIEAEVA